MKRILSAAVCFSLCLSMLAGCTGKTQNNVTNQKESSLNTELPVTTENTESIESDLPVVSDEPDEKEPKESEPKESEDISNYQPQPDEPDTYASLVGIRQSMIGTPSMMAVAYLGATDSTEASDTVEWVKKHLPYFCEDLSFVTAIDDEHIIGEKFGEIYLIVPCDENASVAVNHIDENNEVTEVLYRSDYGEPIIVFANNSGYLPNLQVNLVDNNGNMLTYSPMLNDLFYLSQSSDAGVLDITPYAESLRYEYNDFLNFSWKIPYAVDLTDTSWDTSYMLMDGSMSEYHISFTGDTVYIQWSDGSYEASWTTITEDGMCMLKFDRGTDNERSFYVLVSEEYDYIYLSQDFTNDAMRCDELKSVMMERTYG